MKQAENFLCIKSSSQVWEVEEKRLNFPADKQMTKGVLVGRKWEGKKEESLLSREDLLE